MQKDINTMVIENIFGEIKASEEKKDYDDLRKYGFYIDSFYITGMTLDEYHRWAKQQSRFYGNYIFTQ